MFAVIWFFSAVIGSVIVAEVSLLTLICALVATPFSILLGVMSGVMGGLGGQGGDGTGIEEASDLAWLPVYWAGDVISVLVDRLSYFLSNVSRSKEKVRTSDSTQITSQTLSYKEEQEFLRKANKAELYANIMFGITLAMDFLAFLAFIIFIGITSHHS